MHIRVFNVAPRIPPEISFLETLACNLWWCWNSDAIDLFRRIDPDLWRDVGRNPIRFLSEVPQSRWAEIAVDEGFRSHLERVRMRYQAMEAQAVAYPAGARGWRQVVAYFSLEYGFHESLRHYAGGLGVLAGDHLKAASDQGLPLVAVGLFYRLGYFQQYLSRDGSQQEHCPENELSCLPMHPAGPDPSTPLTITVPLPEGSLRAAVWRLQVGRVPVFLLDTNVEENPPAWRAITAQLYGGSREVRLRQELLLGIGGVRALLALGYEPAVSHVNEGHAAFLNLARMAHLVQVYGMDLDAAREVVRRTSVFTTHTPVAAGNEVFEVPLVRSHLEAVARELPIAPEVVLSWGRAPGAPESHGFSMTILGLRLSQLCNGVSRLHGRVARSMWAHLWPGRPIDEVPITHVTNGVHAASWLSPDNLAVFDRYVGGQWREHPGAATLLQHIDQIPDDELWRAHELGRSRLVRIVRRHVERQLRARHAPRAEIEEAAGVLDAKILTVGFARRFAGYKRATMLLHDPTRLEALLTREDFPIQIIFSGKAHPADEEGKRMIREIVQFASRPSVRRRMVFLEDYDLYLARSLVQGIDVWLNTPRRPLEASGTSGMKAALNGVLNVSVLDGWWCEGYAPDCGWAIGDGEEYPDPAYQDAVEAQALYNLLEEEVVPCFYDRSSGEIPRRWVAMMKASMKMALRGFTSHRMVREYAERFYHPAMATYQRLTGDGGRSASAVALEFRRLSEAWPSIRVEAPTADRDLSSLHAGDRLEVQTVVRLAPLRTEDVEVQVYYGPVDSQNRIGESHVVPMRPIQDLGQGTWRFAAEVECRTAGRYGFTTRVVPADRNWWGVIPGFLTWAAAP